MINRSILTAREKLTVRRIHTNTRCVHFKNCYDKTTPDYLHAENEIAFADVLQMLTLAAEKTC